MKAPSTLASPSGHLTYAEGFRRGVQGPGTNDFVGSAYSHRRLAAWQRGYRAGVEHRRAVMPLFRFINRLHRGRRA